MILLDCVLLFVGMCDWFLDCCIRWDPLLDFWDWFVTVSFCGTVLYFSDFLDCFGLTVLTENRDWILDWFWDCRNPRGILVISHEPGLFIACRLLCYSVNLCVVNCGWKLNRLCYNRKGKVVISLWSSLNCVTYVMNCLRHERLNWILYCYVLMCWRCVHYACYVFTFVWLVACN